MILSLVLLLACLSPRRGRGSPIVNPLRHDGDISKIIPYYLQTSSAAGKQYYNETPALHLQAADVTKNRAVGGAHISCSDVDFQVKWQASVTSSVYSTPLIFLSAEGKKHILVSTFHQTLEMLEQTGFKPWGWPITFEGSTFQGTPILYDVDGDGIDDIGVVDKNANVYFVRMGEFGQYLEDYHVQVPQLKIKKDWFAGLDADFADYQSMMSMFDRKEPRFTSSKDKRHSAEDKDEKPRAEVRPDDLSLDRPPNGQRQRSIPRKIPLPEMHGRRLQQQDEQPGGQVAQAAMEAAAYARQAAAIVEAEAKARQQAKAAAQEEQARQQAQAAMDAQAAAQQAQAALDAQAATQEVQNAAQEAQAALDAQAAAEEAAATQARQAALNAQADVEAQASRDAQPASDTAAAANGGGDGGVGVVEVPPPNADDEHSFRGAASHHGFAEGEGAKGGEAVEGAHDGDGSRPEDFPDPRMDDYVASRDSRDYYGSGSGRPPIRSFDDGYHYDMMGYFNDTQFVFMDPHVLGSPVLVDVNNDGRMELIMAISYYFDKTEHAAMHAKGVDFEPDNYLAGGLVCWDLRSQEWSWTVHLDLTTDKSKFKALIYASPTVVDLDGDGRSEVLIGTSLGLLYVLDGETGFPRRHFPMQFHEIQAQIAVADVHGGLHLEIIVADMAGNLVLVNIDGEILWDTKLSGTLPYTPTVGDVNGDGALDIVVVALQDSVSHLWALDGSTGVALEGYPIKLPSNGMFSSSALLVDLSLKPQQGMVVSSTYRSQGLHIVVPSFDGYLYLIDGKKKCYDRIDIGDHMYTAPLLDDVTGDGTLDIVLGTINNQVMVIETSVPYHPMNVWSSFPRFRLNGFAHGQTGILLIRDNGLLPRKEASDFQNYSVTFEIWDTRKHSPEEEKKYRVFIGPGANHIDPMFEQEFSEPGLYTVLIAIQPPEHLALIISMVNEHGQRFEDHFVISATTTFHHAIKYLSVSLIVGLFTLLTLVV